MFSSQKYQDTVVFCCKSFVNESMEAVKLWEILLLGNLTALEMLSSQKMSKYSCKSIVKDGGKESFVCTLFWNF